MKRANIPVFVPHAGCPQQCSFCSQKSISGAFSVPGPAEAARLCCEALQRLPSGGIRAEIAFFGGSFTAIPREEMCALLEAVQPFLTDSRISGIRVSTRPDAIDREVLDILAGFHVTAVELGAQSMYPDVLEANRRGHTREDILQAAELVKEYNFTLGLQMMTGLYGSSREKDFGTGEQLAALSPAEVRIYPTTVLAGTELDALMKKGLYTPPTLEETVECCADLLTLFEDRGIRVLRLGLHASEFLSAQTTGGCTHPAIGELCRARLFRRALLRELTELGPGKYSLYVARQSASQVLGQHRENMAWLRDQGYLLEVHISGEMDRPYQIEGGKEALYAAEGH